MIKKILLGLLALFLIFLVYVAVTVGPDLKAFFTYSRVDLNEDLTVLLGYGGNTVVWSDSAAGEILIVDTKIFGGAGKLKDHVDRIAADPDIVIVNTHLHPDHTGGNTRFPGATILAGSTGENVPHEGGRIIRIRPGEQHKVAVGSDTAFVRNVGSGHAAENLVVYIPKHGLLIAGDLLFHRIHPALFDKEGTDIDGWIQALDTLAEWPAKTVVPGHGAIAGPDAILEAKEYFVSIRDAIGDPEKLKALEKRYADYKNVPLSTSFQNTVKFMRKNAD